MKSRFDFVELNVQGDSDMYIAQVGAMFAVMDKHEPVEAKKMYMCVMWLAEEGDGEYHSDDDDARDHLPQSESPFRRFKYVRNRNNRVHRQVLSVEYVNGPALVVPESCSREAVLSEDPIAAHAVLAAIEFTFFSRPLVLPLRHFLDRAADRVRMRATCEKGKLPYLVEDAKSPAVRRRYMPAADNVPAPRKRTSGVSARAVHSRRVKRRNGRIGHAVGGSVNDCGDVADEAFHGNVNRRLDDGSDDNEHEDDNLDWGEDDSEHGNEGEDEHSEEDEDEENCNISASQMELNEGSLNDDDDVWEAGSQSDNDSNMSDLE